MYCWRVSFYLDTPTASVFSSSSYRLLHTISTVAFIVTLKKWKAVIFLEHFKRASKNPLVLPRRGLTEWPCRRSASMENHTESWSNMMPYAQWAKFDTIGSIKHWLNVINKPVEPSCGPCIKKRPKISPSEPKSSTTAAVFSSFCSDFRAYLVGLSSKSRKNILWQRHPHLYQLEPCAFTVTCTILLFINEFMFPSREEKNKFSQKRCEELSPQKRKI